MIKEGDKAPAFDLPADDGSRVSDPVERLARFRDKYALSFPLLSDEEGAVCRAYGVWKKKSLYGRQFMGIERTTFVIGPDGKIRKVFPKVKVKGHAEAVAESF